MQRAALLLLLTALPLCGAGPDPATSNLGFAVAAALELLFGVFYWKMVVEKLPLMTPGMQIPEEARAYQKENEVAACMRASAGTILLACCCLGSRVAHTYHITGVLDYWPSLLAGACCPGCFVFFGQSFTDINVKLGGEKKDCVMGCLCGMCCTPCVVAKEAHTLDIIMSSQDHSIELMGAGTGAIPAQAMQPMPMQPMQVQQEASPAAPSNEPSPPSSHHSGPSGHHSAPSSHHPAPSSEAPSQAAESSPKEPHAGHAEKSGSARSPSFTGPPPSGSTP